MGIFSKPQGKGELHLTACFPDPEISSLEDGIKKVQENCGWPLKLADKVEEVPVPTPEELKMLRWLVPLDLVLYGAIGLGLWWLALRLPGPVVLSFVLLGGLEGVAEHVVGILGLRILDRVPWLHGLAPLPILVFSFFEYVLYWTLVAWLAWGLAQLLPAG